jgi:hypothetical protein
MLDETKKAPIRRQEQGSQAWASHLVAKMDPHLFPSRGFDLIYRTMGSLQQNTR